MNNISFNVENIPMPKIDQTLVKRWVGEIATKYGKMVGDISYIFTDDEGILATNRDFLNHDYYTDIITFDYSRRRLISGDLYISLDTVKSNSEQFSVNYENELYRVIIHGILHLCGINDKGPGEREIMEQHENEALKELQKLRENANKE